VAVSQPKDKQVNLSFVDVTQKFVDRLPGADESAERADLSSKMRHDRIDSGIVNAPQEYEVVQDGSPGLNV
jgi:hypothetical protein